MEKCACKGDFLDRFVQPAVLTLLAERPSHGFRLMAEMKKRRMVSGSALDPAGFYRTLKRMEEAGRIVSHLEDTDTIKPRRVFSLTEAGWGCMRNWYGTLDSYRSNIDVIMSGMEDVLPLKTRGRK